MRVLTVNTGRREKTEHTDAPGGETGIGKVPVEGPVRVADPGPAGVGGGGVAGDAVCDLRHHGGSHRAVYAFAREELDRWEEELGRPLPNGSFGENLTTSGVDVDGALLGERWRIGASLVLEVTDARVPCRTFAGRLGERGWVRRFTERGAPGAYLRVVEPGEVRAGDPVEIAYRPGHGVTVAVAFRARTTRRELLPQVLAAGDAPHPELLEAARRYAERTPRTPVP
ncbi:MOSC domain-containing protein [Streptomyces sp. MRC013]|uniref:MOSC domain-containing protein n=1 Tax=Streptomyces sp. MRC013 TaxID=2898276 RepID=UPI0020273DA7|nr:MOSC domain-containing protein [Streptomyces sp. MRC013]URM92648.1 MOSC domain-containing protein [Streptomyces sp. MRC013]